MSKATRTPMAGTPELRPDSRPKSFNPWKFGKVTMPHGLRQEIIGTELPVIPAERLYSSARTGEKERPDPSEAERRGSLLAAGAVVLLFGVVMLGVAMLGSATTEAGAAPMNGERAP